MSFTYFKSLQSIDNCQQWSIQLRTELNIIHSYLNIDEWTKPKQFTQILQEKLFKAKNIKQKLMKFHGIKDHKQVVGFRCKICPSIFDQPTALGGHMSKAHPNSKKQLKQVQIRREMRDQIKELMKEQIIDECMIDEQMIDESQQRMRQSSIQRIKKEQNSLHYEITRIHRDEYDNSNELDCYDN